jgi:hypothetical protein
MPCGTGKIKKDDLVKALDDAGQRESALLLKNWDEMDDTAELMKSKLEKQMEMDAADTGVNAAKADECHEDDPDHEKKEIKIARKQKELAEKQLDIHKKEE